MDDPLIGESGTVAWFEVKRVADKVSVWVPSSVANVGPGFDVHSVALAQPSLKVTLRAGERGIVVVNEGRYAREITTDIGKHAGARALAHMYHRFGIQDGAILENRVEIPPKKGLGLSGAEAAGAVFAANQMYGLNLPLDELAFFAATGEPGQHMDNVVASIRGGFNIVVRDSAKSSPLICHLDPPADLGVAIIVPSAVKASTEEARKALPSQVPLPAYVEMLGRISLVSTGFAMRRVDLILKNIPWDTVVEPSRAGAGAYGSGVTRSFLEEEKKYLWENFRVAHTLSGAGPAWALWYSIREDREKRREGPGLIEPAIRHAEKRLEELGFGVERIVVTKPSRRGVRLLRT